MPTRHDSDSFGFIIGDLSRLIRAEMERRIAAAGLSVTPGEGRTLLNIARIGAVRQNVLADRNERALYKMICDGTTGRVVGLHMIGPDAPEILQAAAVAVKAGLTKDAFDQTVALHPTMSEELVLMK